MPSLQEVTGQDESEITKVETPSGLEIAFRAEPRQYWVNEIPVPGVTTILGILGNEALPWWGMTVGVEGVQTLAGMSALKDDETMDWLVLSSVDEIVKRLTAEKLTVNHNLGKSADRGTSVHLGLERWCETGVLPDPEKWPEEERGYIRGLIGFLEAVQPRPIHSELMVGSAKHGFAGRFDLFAETDEKEVRPTPRKKRQIPAGRGIWDLKSRKGDKNKAIYTKDLLQVQGYRICLEESYNIRSDYEAVVSVREGGGWDIEVSDKKPYQYLAVKSAWEALQ
jgi:hypothetical protein